MNKIEAIKKLREITGLGLVECRTALEAVNWNIDDALNYAKENIKPSTKPVGAGAVFSYIHHNKLIGVLLELGCGTDFVAMNDDFKKLGNNIAMHIASTDQENIESLLLQPYLKDTTITVGDLVNTFSARFNEPIKIVRFSRYVVGNE